MSASLPPLVKLTDFGNDWEVYLEELYQIYLDEVVNAGLTFRGSPLRVQFRPMTHSKAFGFWHLISEGEDEEERKPDLRRCERVPWISWVIRNAESNPDILWWENRRGSSTHIVLWLKEEKFAVILAERGGYYLLKSAYSVAPKREQTFEREWQRFWKKG